MKAQTAHQWQSPDPPIRLNGQITGIKEHIMPIDRIILGGFPILQTTSHELSMYLLDSLQCKRHRTLLFANTNFIVQCRRLSAELCDESVLIVNDGVGLDIAALLIQRSRFKENLNGTDFTPYLLRQAKRPLRLFLLGGKPHVAVRAAEYARQQLGQEVVGVCDGYAGMSEVRLLEHIARSQPDILLVALGNPTQEQWILKHRSALKLPLIMGVGALFDFWAGAKPRAPRVVQSLRLEWLYRLCLEPRRLLRRYTLDIVRFLLYCYRYR